MAALDKVPVEWTEARVRLAIDLYVAVLHENRIKKLLFVKISSFLQSGDGGRALKKAIDLFFAKRDRDLRQTGSKASDFTLHVSQLMLDIARPRNVFKLNALKIAIRLGEFLLRRKGFGLKRTLPAWQDEVESIDVEEEGADRQIRATIQRHWKYIPRAIQPPDQPDPFQPAREWAGKKPYKETGETLLEALDGLFG